jgi:DNA-binding transcriptional ArsR family regulator
MDPFVAIADPVRRQIIARLASAESSAGELGQAFAISASAVSQHLKALREAGLVRVRVEGQKRVYRLDPERFQKLQEWLATPALPRNTKVSIPTLVDATDLEAWADRRDSQSLLPILVRRLLLASGNQIKKISFRSGEGVQLAGCDGTVLSEGATAFVPQGSSVWELGTAADVRKKLNGDYRKRTQNPEGIDPAQTTFVFVVPRRWPAKATWAAERNAEGYWKDVRVFDADDLQCWLEGEPAVHVWVSMLIGTHVDGAADLETFWADWSNATDPAISVDFLLSGRRELATELQKWFASPLSNTLALQAESADEALAVLAASILELPDEQRLAILGRTLVVDTASAWNTLALMKDPLFLIMRFNDDRAIGRATRNGHRVLIPLGGEDGADSSKLVPRLARRDAESALRAAGIEQERAAQLAELARRSVTTFRRKLAIRPEVQRPLWSSDGEGRNLIPALLAGSWNNQASADREILARFARREYEQLQDTLNRWVHTSDPPVRRLGDLWQLVSKEDAWDQLGHNLRQEDLDRFREAALDVLGVSDPKFDLPGDERWLAAARGTARRHSPALCAGIAESLAIMGSRRESIRISGSITLRQVASSIVRELFTRANRDWRIWASIARFLPLLAESAPDDFLGGVESGLAGDTPPIMALFVEQPSPIFSSSEHTGLLWALETVAWSSDFLGRATMVLAQLARRDPGGRLANRPEESLRAIFLTWLPQTSAPIEERLRVIDRLRQRESDVGWTLMRQMLPESYSIGHPTAKPRWREWALDINQVTRREVYFVTKEVLQRMLEDVGSAGRRWENLIAALPSLPPDQYQLVVDRLASLDPAHLDPADQTTIWNGLRQLLSRHRSFPDADWSLPMDRLEILAPTFDRLRPRETLAQFGWLFADRVQLPEGVEQDFRRQDLAVAAARLAAIQTIYNDSGLSGVVALIERVERPFFVGVTLGGGALADANEDGLLQQYLAAEVPSMAEFARGFVAERYRVRGFSWARARVEAAASTWSATQRGTFLACLPHQSATWDLVERNDPETQRQYWRMIHPWGLDNTERERVARKLLEHDRPYTAINILSMGVRQTNDIPATIIVKALELAIGTDPKTDGVSPSFSFEVSKLLNHLKPGDGIDESQIARLEWLYLPLLRFDRSPQQLHRELSREPEFFAEVISIVYHAEGEEPREVTDEQRAQARRGHILLESWRTLPGSSPAGEINSEELRNWVRRARELTQEKGRGKIADQTIGKMLSAGPAGTDGLWPGEPVRELIEDLASADLELGFEIGVYNSRGVVTKNLAEGGEQERQLTKRFEKTAEPLSSRWPRTAAMLRRLADTYRVQSRHEDDQSELIGQLDR